MCRGVCKRIPAFLLSPCQTFSLVFVCFLLIITLDFILFLIDYYLGKNKKPIFATENN